MLKQIRILMMNTYSKMFPDLICCDTFGKEKDIYTKLAPSDHWGVFCYLDFL